MLRHWKIIAASGALLVAAGITTFLIKGDKSGGPPSDQPCGLVAAYGGIFEVPSGVEVEVNDDNRAGLLERVHVCVESQLAEDASARYRQMTDTLIGPDGSSSEQAERNLVEIELAAALAGTDAVTQQRQVARRLIRGWLELDDIVGRQGAGAVLNDSGWQPDRVAHRDKAAAYSEGCKNAGVPVPGSFATDTTWKLREHLDSETHRYFFRSDWNDTEIWTYKDAASGGFCVALVRRKSDKAEQYAGTICTNSSQQKACFFDNVVYDGTVTKRISWEDFQKLDFSELVHPKDGKDFCNTCHLGNNPFIRHPKTMLGAVIESMYPTKVSNSQKFEFIGLGNAPSPWTNFDMIVSPGLGGCFDCHGLPQVTSEHRFCASIIEKAANSTMPPGHWPAEPQRDAPWFWPNDAGCFAESLAPLAAYFPSLVRLKSICSGRAEETCKSK